MTAKTDVNALVTQATTEKITAAVKAEISAAKVAYPDPTEYVHDQQPTD